MPLTGFIQGLFSKWQENFSIDLYGDYKIIRQVLNLSLKGSLKTVIAELDTFGAVKKRVSRHLLTLLPQGGTRLCMALWRVLAGRSSLSGEMSRERDFFDWFVEECKMRDKKTAPSVENDRRRRVKDWNIWFVLFIPQVALKRKFTQLEHTGLYFVVNFVPQVNHTSWKSVLSNLIVHFSGVMKTRRHPQGWQITHEWRMKGSLSIIGISALSWYPPQ